MTTNNLVQNAAPWQSYNILTQKDTLSGSRVHRIEMIAPNCVDGRAALQNQRRPLPIDRRSAAIRPVSIWSIPGAVACTPSVAAYRQTLGVLAEPVLASNSMNGHRGGGHSDIYFSASYDTMDCVDSMDSLVWNQRIEDGPFSMMQHFQN